MKQKSEATKLEYLKRINTVLDYIEKNLDHDFSLMLYTDDYYKFTKTQFSYLLHRHAFWVTKHEAK